MRKKIAAKTGATVVVDQASGEREFLRRIAFKLRADAQRRWRDLPCCQREWGGGKVSFTDEQLTAIRGGLTAEQ